EHDLAAALWYACALHRRLGQQLLRHMEAAPRILQHIYSTRCHKFRMERYKAIWRDMPIKQGKTGTCPAFYMARHGSARTIALPLVGRVARRSAAKAGGVGVVVSGRISRANSDPRPQPLPTRGSGADRVGCPVVRQIERNTP